jgi:N-acylglucosamine-6-phosphate 2-epimerase
VTDVAVMLVDGSDRWCGGICGTICWGWLEVDYLWITPRLRGKGFGTQLVNEIASMAISRGAKHVHLSTFSFQARGFYEQLGFTVVGELGDYPPGESFYWMKKELEGGAATRK